MKQVLRSLSVLVVGALVGLAVLGAAYAGSVNPFTGPSGTNPIQGIPGTLPDFNTAVNSLNAAISNGAGGGAQVGIFTGATFQLGSVTSVGSLTLGLKQPTPSTLGSTTVKFFLTFVDSQGVLSYIPVWQ